MYTQIRCCCWFSDSEDVDTLARCADVECRAPETSEAKNWEGRFRFLPSWVGGDTYSRCPTKWNQPCLPARISTWQKNRSCQKVENIQRHNAFNHFPETKPCLTEISFSFSLASACTWRKPSHHERIIEDAVDVTDLFSQFFLALCSSFLIRTDWDGIIILGRWVKTSSWKKTFISATPPWYFPLYRSFLSLICHAKYTNYHLIESEFKDRYVQNSALSSIASWTPVSSFAGAEPLTQIHWQEMCFQFEIIVRLDEIHGFCAVVLDHRRFELGEVVSLASTSASLKHNPETCLG